MRLYILDLGWIEGDENWFVRMETFATASNKDAIPNWVKAPVTAVLIDHPDGKILYDTGCCPESSNDTMPYICPEGHSIEEQLALAGAKPEEIKTVILSHLHYDHAGNIELFPNARVIAPKEDFDFALKNLAEDEGFQVHSYLRRSIEALPENLHLVSHDEVIAPGVKVFTLPGHTPGLLGLLVELDGGNMFFPSDSTFTRKNYGPPFRFPAETYDEKLYVSSIEKAWMIEKETGAAVIIQHDAGDIEKAKKAPEYYM